MKMGQHFSQSSTQQFPSASNFQSRPTSVLGPHKSQPRPRQFRPTQTQQACFSPFPAAVPYRSSSNLGPSKPFLGKRQWCRERRHVLSQCASFTQQFPSAHPPATNTKPDNRRSSNTLQVLATKMSPLAPTHDSNTWLLDSGASHHVTNDLANLSIHTPYDGTEELIVGDGKSISIAHTGLY